MKKKNNIVNRLGRIIKYVPDNQDKKRYPHYENAEICYRTEVYEILVNRIDIYTHIKIHRIDDKPIHNYLDFQAIKNFAIGEDYSAIEVYPIQSDFKDGSNTYHLWHWKDMEIPNLAKIPKYF